jgi:asparagine synthase (glutamine-hydrolysing)
MCGLAGAIGFPTGLARHAVSAMCDQMLARGPDDGGVIAVEDTVVLGSRRLAIIDPSAAGHQPMTDAERETTIVFNGMIYNYRALRAELISAGERFASYCDTEVILRAYGRWGLDFVPRLHGMFAFAIWDHRQEQLVLARDRLGIKPLYYARNGSTLLFASQVKAMLQSGLVPTALSHPGIQTYLTLGSVLEPLTAIDGILAVPAAHVGVFARGELVLRPYWEPPIAKDVDVPSQQGASEQLRGLLESTMESHLVSDAPLGVFLSGGLDSSVLAALGTRATADLHTVSVEFEEQGFSEHTYMRALVEQIGSRHTAVTLSPTALIEGMPEAFSAMDQPSFDGLNTYAVARAAHDAGLKVAVSGLGADELFDGYGYVRRIRTLEHLRRMPRSLTRAVRSGIGPLGVGRRDKLEWWLSSRSTPGASYELLRSVFLPDDVAALSRDAGGLPLGPLAALIDPDADLYRQVSTLDLTTYTRNVLLRDTDAMSMANSVEVRVPYLDDQIVDWGLRLPGAVKGAHKRVLVDAARGLVPEAIRSRRKQGFLLPLERWLRVELAEDVRMTLHDPPAPLAEFLRKDALAAEWRAFDLDASRWLRVWTLFALCKWCDTVFPSREVRAA